MCGITGFVHLNKTPIEKSILQQMTDAIRHRGPDDEGLWIKDNVALGHRRLSIIDLSKAGHQPMQTKDGRYIISYNGEVYNFKSLRSTLQSEGFSFFSKTDTEVVLNAYSAWQDNSFLKLNGMFAFALMDCANKQLRLVRDRYGIKPLYYYYDNNVFIFGSEIKAILQHPDYKTKLNREALVEYCTFQNFFTENTLFDGIKMVPAGSCLTLNTETGSLQTTRYWDFNFAETPKTLKESEYLEQLDFYFRQGLERQLVSDVPVSAYLSGGMDSGSITVLAAEKLPNLKSFTIGFDRTSASGLELAYDEREKAEYISYLAKTEHYQMVLKAGDMERAMKDLVWHLEEPRVGQSYPNFYAAKLAAKFGKVVLAGTGGDEIFGGYPWRYYRAVTNHNFEDYLDKYYFFWQRLLSQEETKSVFAPIWNDVKDVDTRHIFRNVFCNRQKHLTKPEDYIKHSLYLEAKTFLHGLLVVEDKLSMAHGLETRVPFLDNDLVDFAMTMPTQLKLGNLNKVLALDENEPGHKKQKYFNKTNDGKLLLRKMMEKYIPKTITNSIKQGFSGPDASWFKGESIDFVRSLLLNPNADLYNVMDYTSVKGLVTEHLEGKKNRRLLIWSLLYLETWLQVFKDVRL